jgi:hypothetical protein
LTSIIIQSIQTIAVLLALLYAWLQIRDAQKKSKIESVWEIYRELAEENVRSSRHYIYNHQSTYAALAWDGSDLSKLEKDDWRNASAVSNSFDRVGFLVAEGLIPVELLKGFKYVIGRCWIILEPFIAANRNARKEPSYQVYFEELANRIFEKFVSPEEIRATVTVATSEGNTELAKAA